MVSAKKKKKKLSLSPVVVDKIFSRAGRGGCAPQLFHPSTEVLSNCICKQAGWVVENMAGNNKSPMEGNGSG